MELLNWEAKEKWAQKATKESLEYSIKDCREAIEAMPDGLRVGYYQDEISVYRRELQKRSAK